MGRIRGVDTRGNSIRIRIMHKGETVGGTLKTNGEPMAVTAANMRYAERLAEEIRQKLRFGTYRAADYFPDQAGASTGDGESLTVGTKLDDWLSLQSSLKPSTLKSYRVSVDWWKSKVGNKRLERLVHSDILRALASEPKWTGKTRNNKVIPMRQMLDLAIRDGIIHKNPIDGLAPAAHQSPEPDPFTADEANLIIKTVEALYGEAMANYFGFKFYTGLRTGESLGLRWGSIDWPNKTMLVKEGLVMGEHIESTKTSRTRTVHLNSNALFYLLRQKVNTLVLPGGWVFVDPKTNERWADDWGPRNTYWEPVLRKLGLRYRSPYQTRHTYATMMLMAGITPAFAARQLGHSVQMFISKYARWMDGAINEVEMGKLENILQPAARRMAS